MRARRRRLRRARLIGVHGAQCCRDGPAVAGAPGRGLGCHPQRALARHRRCGADGAVCAVVVAGRSMADRMNRELCVRGQPGRSRRPAARDGAACSSIGMGRGSRHHGRARRSLAARPRTRRSPPRCRSWPGRDSDDATGLLVTVEVGAFFVGPGPRRPRPRAGACGDAGVYAAAGLTLLAVVVMRLGRLGRTAAGACRRCGVGCRPVRRARSAHRAVAAGAGRSGRGRDQQRGRWRAEHRLAAARRRRLEQRRTCSSGWRPRHSASARLLAPVLLRVWGIDVGAGRRSALLFAGFLVDGRGVGGTLVGGASRSSWSVRRRCTWRRWRRP